MSLYDVIDDISAKQVTKTDTGDNRINGVVVGVVTDNYDEKYKGRVCVKIPSRDNECNILPWVRVIQPSSGKNYGHYFLPEPNDQVLVAFEGGNIEKPYVIGCIPKDNSQLVSKAANEKNEVKRIISTRGNTIELNDKENEEFVSINTPEDAQLFKLDKGNDRITLRGKEGKVNINADTKEGEMQLHLEKSLRIEVGDVKITINGSAGSIKIQCSNFTIDSSGEVKITAASKLTVDSKATTVSGSGQVKIDTSGTLTAGGSLIKLG